MCSFNHNLYNLFMLPMERSRLNQKRTLLFEDVAGDVLEIGFGTGANLSHYPYEQFDSLTLSDMHLPEKLDLTSMPKNLPLEVVRCDAVSLPFEDEQFDSVVFTLVFCTVGDPSTAFKEIHRVLKPDGRIYFIEHVEPVNDPYKNLFNYLTPVWKRLAHGCHLNRRTMDTIQRSNFELLEYHRFYRTSFVSGIAVKID